MPRSRLVVALGGGGIAGVEAEMSVREGTRWVVFALSRGNKDTPRNSEYKAGVASSSGGHTGQQVQKQQHKPELPANWKATNTKGVEICRKWNGSPNGCEHRCPQNRAHQCAICLSTHRACQHDTGGGNKSGKAPNTGGGQNGGPKKRARKGKKAGK